jgi:hypothetical protein
VTGGWLEAVKLQTFVCYGRTGDGSDGSGWGICRFARRGSCGRHRGFGLGGGCRLLVFRFSRRDLGAAIVSHGRL